MTDSRPGCANHSCQVFLIDFGEDNLDSPFPVKMRQQQEESPSWALLAGVEKPIEEILPNARDAFPGLFSTLFLTWNFKELNLSRRVRGAVWVCRAVPRGLGALSVRAVPLRQTATRSGPQHSA